MVKISLGAVQVSAQDMLSDRPRLKFMAYLSVILGSETTKDCMLNPRLLLSDYDLGSLIANL